MNITDLYQTEIICRKLSNSNPQSEFTIDEDSILVVVKLIDFNKVLVKNKNVTLKVSKGYFSEYGYLDSEGATSVHKTNTVSGTSTTSVVLNTNSTGYAYALCPASEWGYIGFKANEASRGVYVDGVRSVTMTSGFASSMNSTTLWFKRSGNLVTITGTGSYASGNLGNSTKANLCTMPSGFAPKETILNTSGINNDVSRMYFDKDGTIYCYTWRTSGIVFDFTVSYFVD